MSILEQLWDELNQQPVHRFADWPNRDVPKGQPGVYLIYQRDRWIYVGMASANLYGLYFGDTKAYSIGGLILVE